MRSDSPLSCYFQKHTSVLMFPWHTFPPGNIRLIKFPLTIPLAEETEEKDSRPGSSFQPLTAAELTYGKHHIIKTETREHKQQCGGCQREGGGDMR
jgi:hypothetical protein